MVVGVRSVATVLQTIGDASLWRSSRVMRCVVLNFTSHDGSPLLKVGVGIGPGIARSAIVGSEALDDVSARGRARVAGRDVSLRSLRPTGVHFASTANTARRNVVSWADRSCVAFA